jgi:hypothetical protein
VVQNYSILLILRNPLTKKIQSCERNRLFTIVEQGIVLAPDLDNPESLTYNHTIKQELIIYIADVQHRGLKSGSFISIFDREYFIQIGDTGWHIRSSPALPRTASFGRYPNEPGKN